MAYTPGFNLLDWLCSSLEFSNVPVALKAFSAASFRKKGSESQYLDRIPFDLTAF